MVGLARRSEEAGGRVLIADTMQLFFAFCALSEAFATFLRKKKRELNGAEAGAHLGGWFRIYLAPV